MGRNMICLAPNAYSRIDEHQKNINQNSKTVFIAMSFSPDAQPIREIIRQAVEESGFIPRIMDEIEHNHQIVPELLHEIKQARFVIAN
jgi:hypothetical protein